MILYRFFCPFALLVSLAFLSQQVDIRIERTFIISGEAESFIAATCVDISAGECCKPPTSYPDATTKVHFRHLHIGDIAAVWGNNQRTNDPSPDRYSPGCSGPLLASRPGPGGWLWRQPATDRRAAEGASYISLPRTLPPKPNHARWLAWEGLLGLEWSGGGTWFADSAAEALIRSGSGILVGAKRRRDVLSTNRGTVFARPPLRMRYPTFVEINGTHYALHNGEEGDPLMYESSGGGIRNLTDWFAR